MTDSLIRKEDAIKALGEEPMVWTDSDFELADRNRWQMDVEALKKLSPVQPGGWLEQNKDRILRAGKEGREVEFRIGGRLFAIREKAQ